MPRGLDSSRFPFRPLILPCRCHSAIGSHNRCKLPRVASRCWCRMPWCRCHGARCSLGQQYLESKQRSIYFIKAVATFTLNLSVFRPTLRLLVARSVRLSHHSDRCCCARALADRTPFDHRTIPATLAAIERPNGGHL